jgi:hypothetical protein
MEDKALQFGISQYQEFDFHKILRQLLNHPLGNQIAGEGETDPGQN